ncbi:hypothetical protein J5N97_027035 [Dioscorea zingiberensis]|uniref:Tudor domain-containing protein n=1 Tax=Dioscorea zingiberensis TaxID=325984 RepID=A0A9D5H7D8_9LILI|nr:hypothetical protein J5N97_027035 [Dioscorea zingiberensis]
MAYPESVLELKLMEVGCKLSRPQSSTKELLALLDKTETVLSKVEQSPSSTISTSLFSATKALVSKKIFRHEDKDVKLAVASCISEITRITAPETPYDDDLMKEVFQRIVEAFEKLDDMTSQSYSRRVSILETVAKVRSCVVMLDLELDELILEMFRHFLRTIGSNDSEDVFSSMETIMTLVLEESEDIPSDLLSCLLASVKKDSKDVLPTTRRLAEKVFANCGTKLKPYLVDTVNSTGVSVSDYSDIVRFVCHGKSDALDQDDLEASKEHLGEDSKLSNGTVSVELPQVSENLEPEVGCHKDDKKAVEKLRKLMTNNGTVLLGNGNSTVEAASSEHKPDKLKPEAIETDDTLNLTTKNVRNQKSSSTQLAEVADISQIDSDKEASTMPNGRKGQGKEADSLSSENLSGKESEPPRCSEPGTIDEGQPPIKLENGAVKVTSLAANEDLGATRPKRSSHPGSKTQVKEDDGIAVVDMSKGDSGKDGTLDEVVVSSKKETNSAVHSEVKLRTRSGKKVHLGNANNDGILATDSLSENDFDVNKEMGIEDTKRTGKKGAPRRPSVEDLSEQKSNIEHQKGKASPGLNELEELCLKEMGASPKSAVRTASKDQCHLDESAKTKSHRKRTRAREEISEVEDNKEVMNESLVGSMIKVWWPDDRRFYRGRIEAFEPATQKHKVVYTDGDVEILLLKNERYELVEGDTAENEGQDEHTPSPSGPPDGRPVKKAKKSDSVPRKGKKDTMEKSAVKSKGKSGSGGKESNNKHGSNNLRPRGRPKSISPNRTSSPASSGKSKKKSANKKVQVSTSRAGIHKEDHPDRSMDESSGTCSADAPSNRKLKDSVSKTGAKPTNAKTKTAGNTNDETNVSGDSLKANRKYRTPMTSSGKSNVNSGSSSSKGKSRGKQSKRPATKESPASDKVQDETVVASGKKRKRKGHS